MDVALPTAGDGWIIPTSNGNYAASVSADRSMAFTDAAAGSQYGGTVNLGANISTPSMTINNAAVEYVFDGAGAYGLSADALVKEGSGNATFKRTTITSPNLQVHGGRLTMGEGAALGGNTAATVTGGALAFNGGYANTTGNITATGGEVAIMSATQLTTPSLSIGPNAALSFNVTAQQLTSTLLNVTGNVFQDLATDAIAFSSAPSATDAMVYVTRLANYGEESSAITVDLTTAPGQAGAYELIDGCGDSAARSCTLTNAALTMLRREHFDGKLQAKDDDLWIDVIYMGENHYPEINGGNAGEGAKMASAAFFELSPQLNRDRYPDLAKALDGLDQYLAAGQQHQAEELAAAVAGAAIPALGEAFRGDVERLLRSIRNRTTTMGLNSCCADPKELPYVNAWINAEGDYRRMQKDGTLSGYKYTTWGGTVGLELGAGIYIPVSQNAGTIFWDASFECRQNDMDFNTTVGYRINF